MQKMIENHGKWTGTAVLILFVLVTVTLGLAAGLTYAGRSESPDQVLTFSKGNLIWDSSMHIDPETGEYELPLFEGMSEGKDGEKIIAPGDGDMKIVRLSNEAEGTVKYTAVIYLEQNMEIPIEGRFANFGEGERTSEYVLPEEVEDAVVLDAVNGEVGSGQVKDFDVQWSWAYEQEDVESGDAADTQLGIDSASAKLGVYIMVVREDVNVDNNGDGEPDINLDTDGDGEPDVNVDTDGDGEPDINIDTDGDGEPDVNVDTDGDGDADLNVDTDGDGEPDINIDTDGDGEPDINIDTDGDGKADNNVDNNGDTIPDTNIDTDGDGKADLNIDTDGDGSPDLNIDTDGDGIADLNIDTDGDGIADLNIDTDGDGIADRNIDADGDGIVDAVALPQAPETGDESHAGMYAGLLAVCILMLSVMIHERRREGRCSR